MGYSDLLVATSLVASFLMALVGAQYRAAHPQIPDYDFSAFGGMLACVSFFAGFHIVFFDRRRPRSYATAWKRFSYGILLWFASGLAMALNMANAAPRQ